MSTHRSRGPGRSRRRVVGGLVCVVAAILAGSAAARQAASGSLDTLFPWRAPVAVESPGTGAAGGLARLFLSGQVLSATRPDLSDLRLLDGPGREIPYAVDRDAGLRRRVGALDTTPAAIRSASQSRSQRDEAVVDWSETYDLAPPPEAWARPRPDARLFLRVVTDRTRFVKQLAVSSIGGRTSASLADESLFRLPDPLRERVRFQLPRDTRGVRVVLEGEDGAWLEPTFVWERETDLADRPEPETVHLALVERSRAEEGGDTVLLLERPRGALPLALTLETTTPLLRRSVTVFDGGPGVPRRQLLVGEIRRVGTGESELSLRWPTTARARGSELEVRIGNRDSPPLEDLQLSLRLARPAILFAADARPARLVWGGARVRAARYDVGALVPPLPATGEAAAIGRAVLEDAALIEASLGDAEPNPRFDPVSPFEFAMAPGRDLDPRRFSHARALTAPASALGLYRLTLGSADQAVLRPDLADLRIVDQQSRQRPYVLVHDSGRERTRVTFRTSHPEGETLLRFELPSMPLTVAGLVLEIDDPFFERSYAVEGQGEASGEVEILARGSLRRERSVDGTPGDRSIEIPLPKRRVRALAFRIADGSDRALSVGRVDLETPAPEVLFPAPPGSYVALLGEPDLRAPRYELESVRDLVQAIDSTVVERGPLTKNEEFSLPARLSRGSGLERTILGIALVVAVLVLTVVTLRLAGPRSPQRGASAAEAEGGVRDSAGDDGAETAAQAATEPDAKNETIDSRREQEP